MFCILFVTVITSFAQSCRNAQNADYIMCPLYTHVSLYAFFETYSNCHFEPTEIPGKWLRKSNRNQIFSTLILFKWPKCNSCYLTLDALYSQNSCYIFHVLHNLYVHYTNQLDENPNEDTIEMASIMKSKRAYKDREDEEQIHKKKK